MKKILVIEDEPNMCFWIETMLELQKYIVFAVEDGNQALQTALEKKPDLIISDVMIDNVNGFMVREELQRYEETKNIPYIFMTGMADNAGAWESEVGVEYLLKPFSAENLLEAVQKQLSGT